MNDLPVVDSAQAAEWDRLAQEDHSIPGRVLMESAGRSCAAIVSRELPEETRRGVVVVAGPGNNGGDGWVVARALRAAGAPVAALQSSPPRTPDCIANRKLGLESGVREIDDLGQAGPVGVVVDALLGGGASGDLRGRIAELVAAIALYGVPVVAIDGPTGVDLSTGEQSGELVASLTVTFGGLRRGHLLNRAACGHVVVTDIGFPDPPAAWPRFAGDAWARRVLPPFAPEMHKGDRGRVVVIGGSDGMTGAAMHAVRAGFAAGAGLIRLVAGPEAVAAAQSALPDALTLTTDFESDPEQEVIETLEWADAVVLGPGLGRSRARDRYVATVLGSCSVPMIIDADALRADLSGIAARQAGTVLTPHPGEFKAMCPAIDLDSAGRFAAARMASEELKCTVLLKGVPTVVAEGTRQLVVASGNPALATGGSGDVLAGLIGAFLARGVDPPSAAALGAQVMGRSAELASAANTVRATRPEHVTGEIPGYWRVLEGLVPPHPPALLELSPPALA